MTKTEKRKIGDIGEDIACKYLENKGFVVKTRNYLKPWGEIDIVAEKANILRFVEVKSVSCESLKSISRETPRPEENMHERKVHRLHRAIQTYLLDKKVPERVNWQIDLACVYLDFTAKKGRVELLENIIL
jgi:putative endonuclease